jgi:hypothetical protein
LKDHDNPLKKYPDLDMEPLNDFLRSQRREHERRMESSHRETERLREREHALKLKQIEQIGSGQGLARMVWKKTARDFGDWILAAHGNGLIDAKSKMAALEQACQHFVLSNGKALNARSIWQSLRNRRDFEGK